MNWELQRIAAVYAPAYENDNQGNMYLDLTGTAGLFGPPLIVPAGYSGRYWSGRGCGPRRR